MQNENQTMVNDFRPFGAAMAKLSTNAKTIERDDGSTIDLPGDGSRPNLASVLQKRRKNASIHASSGVIWRIPVKNYILIYLRGVRLADLLPDAATTHAGIEQGSFAEPSHPSSDELH